MNGAGSMLRSATASDVLFETCSGGAGGAVAVAVGDAQMRELHDAVAEAARASVAGENLAENLAENPAGARDEDADGSGTLPKALPLHEDYFSTRALRRMVLEIPGNDDRGVFQKDATRRDGTPPFAAALWEGAVSRDVAAWIGGHGAKVVAAIVKSGDAATRKACIAALTKALPKGQSPTTWAEGFFRQRAEGTKETKETKETKKADESEGVFRRPRKRRKRRRARTKTPRPPPPRASPSRPRTRSSRRG